MLLHSTPQSQTDSAVACTNTYVQQVLRLKPSNGFCAPIKPRVAVSQDTVSLAYLPSHFCHQSFLLLVGPLTDTSPSSEALLAHLAINNTVLSSGYILHSQCGDDLLAPLVSCCSQLLLFFGRKNKLRWQCLTSFALLSKLQLNSPSIPNKVVHEETLQKSQICHHVCRFLTACMPCLL